MKTLYIGITLISLLTGSNFFMNIQKENELLKQSLNNTECVIEQMQIEIGKLQSETDSLTREMNTIMIIPARDSRFQLTSNVGWRKDPVNGNVAFHGGIDLVTYNPNAEIISAIDGTITRAGWISNTAGFGVWIEDSTRRVCTYHMDKIYVKEGDRVSPGQLIGLEGNTGKSTGNHIHFELWEKDQEGQWTLQDPTTQWYRNPLAAL